VGLQTERQRTHMAETDHILEILLRLVRGEHATPFTQAARTRHIGIIGAERGWLPPCCPLPRLCTQPAADTCLTGSARGA
jgi:hypothetical protein